MTAMRALCFVGLHPVRIWQFVGDSWNPDLYIRVCKECGLQQFDTEDES